MTSSLAAWRSSPRAISVDAVRPTRNTSRNTRLNLTRSFMAWLAGSGMGGRGVLARRRRRRRVQDGAPFRMRLQAGDEPAAELRVGGEAAPALGEHAAQGRLGVDPGLG